MDAGSRVRRVPALAVGTATWLRDEEANARERAPVMGADDRPNLTATDHSMWHPVELRHASERQRDQLPNHALLDQGDAAARRRWRARRRALRWDARPARARHVKRLPKIIQAYGVTLQTGSPGGEAIDVIPGTKTATPPGCFGQHTNRKARVLAALVPASRGYLKTYHWARSRLRIGARLWAYSFT